MPVLVHVSVKLDKKLVEKIDAIAAFKGVTRSDVVREALERYVEEEWRKTVPRPRPKMVRLEC